MTRVQINIRWAVTAGVSWLLILLLAVFLPTLPSFGQLSRSDGVVNSSVVNTRPEAGQMQTVFVVTLDGLPNATYVVKKSDDLGYYRATQTVASGDDVTLWTYPIRNSKDLRIWQLSDRNMLIVNYNEVYGVEKQWHFEFVFGILFLILLINVINVYLIKWYTAAPEPPPPMLGFGD
jgi:hypothetical protein